MVTVLKHPSSVPPLTTPNPRTRLSARLVRGIGRDQAALKAPVHSPEYATERAAEVVDQCGILVELPVVDLLELTPARVLRRDTQA